MRTKRITPAQWIILRQHLPTADRLLCSVMLQTGYRVSDALSITANDLASTRLQICERKTGKTRVTHISSKTLGALRKYAAAHGRIGNDAVISMDESTVYRHITAAAAKCGFEHISAHSFRKAYATDYCNKYGLAATQKELLHDNIATTLLYVYDYEQLSDVLHPNEEGRYETDD